MAFFKDSPPEWGDALDHLKSALRILDETNAPDDIAPHLDLSMCRLEEAMGRSPNENSAQCLHEQIDEAFANVMAETTNAPAPMVWA
jgi:hypothetical protein